MCRKALERRRSEDEPAPQTASQAVKVVLTRIPTDDPHRGWVMEKALSHTVDQLEKRERELERLTRWLMGDLASLEENRAFQVWREQQEDRYVATYGAIMRPPAEEQQKVKRKRLAANIDDQEETS